LPNIVNARRKLPDSIMNAKRLSEKNLLIKIQPPPYESMNLKGMTSESACLLGSFSSNITAGERLFSDEKVKI